MVTVARYYLGWRPATSVARSRPGQSQFSDSGPSTARRHRAIRTLSVATLAIDR